MSPELAAALRAAASLLERRDLSAAELEGRLRGSGHNEESAAEALEWLHSNGYLDDYRVAERTADQALNRRGWGRSRVEARLHEMQVAPEATSAVLGRLDEDTERKLAMAALTKRFKGKVEAVKAARFLSGRGFSEAAIRGALGEAVPGWDD